MANKYIKNDAGTLAEEELLDVSAGRDDSGKGIALDSAGRVSQTMMPTGIGADTTSIEASEALTAGAEINLFDDAGVGKVRLADNSNNRPAHGFVLSAVALGESAIVYFEGVNTARSGMTIGAVQFLGTAGNVIETAPTDSDEIVQRIGVARSATEMTTERSQPITLA